MNPSHQGAQVTFDMASCMGLAGRSVGEPDIVALTSAAKGFAVKLAAIVQV
jgi:hypothetical protein